MLRRNRNEKLTGVILTLLPFGLILINIKLFNIGEAAFKPIHIIVLMAIIFGLSKGFFYKKLLVMIIYSIIPLFSLRNIVSLPDFVSTYLVYLMSLLLIFIAMPQLLKIDVLSFSKMFKTLFLAFNATAIYGILQFLMANIFNNYSLYNNLGKFQFHRHLYNRIFGIYRATSIYIEPSVFAWISITVLVLTLYLFNTPIMEKKAIKVTIIFASLSVLISFSSSGFISYFIVIFFFIFYSKKNYFNLLYRIAVLFFIALLVLLQPKQLKYLRLSDITIQGTSGYARLIEPFFAMKEVLTIYPLMGRGLGQIGVYDPHLKYNIYINNSLFGSVVTFGLNTILYIVPICIRFYRIIKHDNLTVILFINLIMIFLSTGSFLSLEMPLIYCLYLFAIEYKRHY